MADEPVTIWRVRSASFKRLGLLRDRYQARKESGLCVRCGAGLQETDETLECVECLASHAASMARYFTSDKGRATRRAETKRRRARLAAAGLCVQCSKPTGGGKKCERCLERHRVYVARHLERKEQEARHAA